MFITLYSLSSRSLTISLFLFFLNIKAANLTEHPGLVFLIIMTERLDQGHETRLFIHITAIDDNDGLAMLLWN